MPTRKDLKRLVRARMEKTGESYTTARAHITHHKLTLPTGYQDLAGQTDQAVQTRTGHDWRAWVTILDGIGATEMSHREIARWIHENHHLGGWWSQTVTVGYERIRGLRQVGQGRNGLFSTTRSRTLPFPEAQVRHAISDQPLRDRWLPSAIAELRSAPGAKSFRFAFPADGTRAVIGVTPKGTARTQVAVAHTGLPDADVARERKVFWGDRLDALEETLGRAGLAKLRSTS